MQRRDWNSKLAAYGRTTETAHTCVGDSQVAHQGFHGLRKNIPGRSWYDDVGQDSRSLYPASPLRWTLHILAVQPLALWISFC